MDGDRTFPFTLSNISPPVFTQPLPDTLPEPLTQASASILSQIPPPYFQAEEPTSYDLLTSEDANSPDSTSPSLGLLTNDLFSNPVPSSDFYDSPIDQPPSSAFPSEVSSALVSDSELLPSSSRIKQADLLGFFSKVPAEELYTKWRKRKRDNEEKYREEYEKKEKKDEEKSYKKA